MEIQEIKQRLSIQAVLKHYGLQPDRNNMLKCPFHADDKPSLKIYSTTNTFNCFGCGKSGDQIEFCTLKEGSKHIGLLKATELTGEIVPINNKPKQQKSQPKENNSEILTRVFESFRNGLSHPVSVKPKEYLKGRNLTHELLEIGYNSGQFHHRRKIKRSRPESLHQCRSVNTLRKSGSNATEILTRFCKGLHNLPTKGQAKPNR